MREYSVKRRCQIPIEAIEVWWAHFSRNSALGTRCKREIHSLEFSKSICRPFLWWLSLGSCLYHIWSHSQPAWPNFQTCCRPSGMLPEGKERLDRWSQRSRWSQIVWSYRGRGTHTQLRSRESKHESCRMLGLWCIDWGRIRSHALPFLSIAIPINQWILFDWSFLRLLCFPSLDL